MKPALSCVLTINGGPMGGFGEGIGIWSLKDHINGEERVTRNFGRSKVMGCSPHCSPCPKETFFKVYDFEK
jgi:hypothetical protein